MILGNLQYTYVKVCIEEHSNLGTRALDQDLRMIVLLAVAQVGNQLSVVRGVQAR